MLNNRPGETSTNLVIQQGLANENRGSDLVVTGSLIFELKFPPEHKAPCRLVDYSSDTGWHRKFTIYLNPDYTLSVESRQGESKCYARLDSVDLRNAGKVRLTYSWDAPQKSGTLSAQVDQEFSFYQVPIKNPIPLPFSDLSDICSGTSGVELDSRVGMIALSDRVAAVGPAPSIAEGALVETSDGPCAIERLNLGDMIETRDSGLQSVRWIVKQELPACGNSRPVRLRAPFLELTKDVVVSENQRLLISGINTEYSLGQESVLISARDLIGHPAAQQIKGQLSTVFYQVVMDNHECIKVSGTWTESLYLGSLKNEPDLIASTALSAVPLSILPVHTQQVQPILHDFERQALLDSLTA